MAEWPRPNGQKVFGASVWTGGAGEVEQSGTPRRRSRRKQTGGPRRARVLATGTDEARGWRGRLQSVEGAKTRVGRGGENLGHHFTATSQGKFADQNSDCECQHNEQETGNCIP